MRITIVSYLLFPFSFLFFNTNLMQSPILSTEMSPPFDHLRQSQPSDLYTLSGPYVVLHMITIWSDNLNVNPTQASFLPQSNIKHFDYTWNIAYISIMHLQLYFVFFILDIFLTQFHIEQWNLIKQMC